ncbi:hypothetical protein OKW39_002382 [Paraburkholderia sp. MM6662-R1]
MYREQQPIEDERLDAEYEAELKAFAHLRSKQRASGSST